MEFRKNLLQGRLPPKTNSGGDMSSKKMGNPKKHNDYTPILWSKYFDTSEDYTIKKNKFRVYRSGNEGPVMLLLHGGGYSALTWALFSTEIKSRVVCQTVAIDLRGHGGTTTENDYDLSIETMATDVGDVLKEIFKDECPQVVVVGHSMGGAVAVHAAAGGHIPSLAGVCVIDVVEGTAMQALASMQSYLRGRPKNFRSLEYAIEWCYRSGQTRNLEAAKVSMPGQLKNLLTGDIATNDVTDYTPIEDSLPLPDKADSIQEESDDEPDELKINFKSPGPSSNSHEVVTQHLYTWRIDLSRTEDHWPGWFRGLSDLFLNHIQASKLLLLASINGLDTDLTVGQMQGKFQMQVLAKCGHAVQEDAPDQVADVLASFLMRNKLTTACGEFIRSFPTC